jgi:hypothetical protein
MTRRRIVGYAVDDEGDMVAVLACGHTQHIRHNPPMVWREWATTSEGRRERLGEALNCADCDRGEPPDVDSPHEVGGIENPEPL